MKIIKYFLLVIWLSHYQDFIFTVEIFDKKTCGTSLDKPYKQDNYQRGWQYHQD